MDWLDEYLDGMGNYKTTVSPADTHIWGVKPKLNSTQQRMIFDATAQSELEYRQLVQEARSALEEHGMSHADVAEGIGSDPGSAIVGSNLSYSISGNNVTVQLPGNASQFNFTVSNSTSTFNITIAGYGSFSMLNYYDANNFENCYLSAYNFNNFSITFNPVYVTATETLISNGQYFTVFYYNTGSALFSISKSEIIEPVPTPSPKVTPSRTPTQTPSPTRTPTTTPTTSPTRTATPSPTVTPTASPAAAITGFGTPARIIVASNNYSSDDQNGYYTRKSPGSNLSLQGYAPIFTLSGTGCGYSCDNGGYAYICSPSSFVMYNGARVSQPQSAWAYIQFGIDVYGNPYYNTIISQYDATDINNMPTFWAKNGGSGNGQIYNIISVCVSAESVDAYLPISTLMLSISGVKFLGNGTSFESRNSGFYYCQPLTASGIDSDMSYPTGNMVWSGAKTFQPFSNGNYMQLFLVYGVDKDYYGTLLNGGRPSWRVIQFNSAYTDQSRNFRMLYNFNTSAFGIPLSGWNSFLSYTDPTQFNAGQGRSNYPILSAATTVASRSSVNVTNANLPLVAGNGNGNYVKDGYFSGGVPEEYLPGTLYANENTFSCLFYSTYNKVWTVIYDYDNTFYAYKNRYAGTRVVPQSGWVDFYTDVPVTFTVK